MADDSRHVEKCPDPDRCRRRAGAARRGRRVRVLLLWASRQSDIARAQLAQRSLDVSSFPTAVFVAQSAELPQAAATGQTVTVSVPGQLTVHGVTKDVTATVQLRVSASTAQLAGSIVTNMTDFGISPPQVSITVVQPAVTIEFQLNLTSAS